MGKKDIAQFDVKSVRAKTESKKVQQLLALGWEIVAVRRRLLAGMPTVTLRRAKGWDRG